MPGSLVLASTIIDRGDESHNARRVISICQSARSSRQHRAIIRLTRRQSLQQQQQQQGSCCRGCTVGVERAVVIKQTRASTFLKSRIKSAANASCTNKSLSGDKVSSHDIFIVVIHTCWLLFPLPHITPFLSIHAALYWLLAVITVQQISVNCTATVIGVSCAVAFYRQASNNST